jgi:hypothetical protein
MQASEDQIEIERAGRRCAICHTGRRWRQFEVVRPEGQPTVVMCPACHARYGATPPVPATEQPPAAPATPADASVPKQRSTPPEDRLRKALRELPPGEHSVSRIAKAAGLNHEKTLSRLHALNAAGEVQQVGKRWSNERPSTDIEAAMDRLQVRTNNLRIVRRREPVG